MKVIVAIPFDYDGTQYGPDEEADLPDAVAKTRIHDGWARLPQAAPDDQTEDEPPVDGTKPSRPPRQTPASQPEPAQSTTDSPTAGANGQE